MTEIVNIMHHKRPKKLTAFWRQIRPLKPVGFAA